MARMAHEDGDEEGQDEDHALFVALRTAAGELARPVPENIFHRFHPLAPGIFHIALFLRVNRELRACRKLRLPTFVLMVASALTARGLRVIGGQNVFVGVIVGDGQPGHVVGQDLVAALPVAVGPKMAVPRQPVVRHVINDVIGLVGIIDDIAVDVQDTGASKRRTVPEAQNIFVFIIDQLGDVHIPADPAQRIASLVQDVRSGRCPGRSPAGPWRRRTTEQARRHGHDQPGRSEPQSGSSLDRDQNVRALSVFWRSSV